MKELIDSVYDIYYQGGCLHYSTIEMVINVINIINRLGLKYTISIKHHNYDIFLKCANDNIVKFTIIFDNDGNVYFFTIDNMAIIYNLNEIETYLKCLYEL